MAERMAWFLMVMNVRVTCTSPLRTAAGRVLSEAHYSHTGMNYLWWHIIHLCEIVERECGNWICIQWNMKKGADTEEWYRLKHCYWTHTTDPGILSGISVIKPPPYSNSIQIFNWIYFSGSKKSPPDSTRHGAHRAESRKKNNTASILVLSMFVNNAGDKSFLQRQLYLHRLISHKLWPEWGRKNVATHSQRTAATGLPAEQGTESAPHNQRPG